MQIQKAKREQAYLKLGVSAVSGGGKTKSALRLARGLCGSWEKICVIDTENKSAHLYSDLGDYNVLTLEKFTPPDYIKAIDVCLQSGMEVIILDSISHLWEWALAYHAKLGGAFSNWKDVNPHLDAFKQKILQCPAHVITTVRRKQKYEMATVDGKTKVQKLGAEEVYRGGWEYELTVNFEIDEHHLAVSTKDRTEMFDGKEPFLITEETGVQLKNWILSAK